MLNNFDLLEQRCESWKLCDQLLLTVTDTWIPLIIFYVNITFCETVKVLLSKTVLLHSKLLTSTWVLNYLKQLWRLKTKIKPPNYKEGNFTNLPHKSLLCTQGRRCRRPWYTCHAQSRWDQYTVLLERHTPVLSTHSDTHSDLSHILHFRCTALDRNLKKRSWPF